MSEILEFRMQLEEMLAVLTVNAKKQGWTDALEEIQKVQDKLDRYKIGLPK